MRRIIYHVIWLFVGVVGGFSCHSFPDLEKEGKTVFRYNESAGITSLDPAFAKDQSSIWAVNQLFNGLVQLDDKLMPQPCIAKSWQISTDGLTYTFVLRNDVYFHPHPLFKGKRKVVASDVVYSFNRIVDEKVASPGMWVFNQVEVDAQGEYQFKAINDTVFQVKLRQPFAPFLGLLSMGYCSVVPKEIVSYYQKDFRKHPIGTGPFVFKLWKEDIKLIFLKNKGYFERDLQGRSLPYLDAVAISFIVDKQSAFLEFVKGNLDFLSGIDPSYKDELLTKEGGLHPKYQDRFTLLTQPYLNTEYLGIYLDNAPTNPLMKKQVRQALNMGFDRSKLIRYLRNNIGTPGVYGFIPPGLPGFDSSVVYYRYQPTKTKALLAEAGYTQAHPLEVSIATTATYLDISKFIQFQLQELGIKVAIDVNPPATLREMVAQGKVPFFRGSWIADYPDAENYLSLFYSKNTAPLGPNYTHFSNPAFDVLYEKSLSEVNDSIRYGLYAHMNRLVMEESPVVVLYYDQILRFIPKTITQLGVNPMNLLDLKQVVKERK